MISMSVENMTNMSYLLFGMSGTFAITAVVLFFAMDIAKCWRMVSGRHISRRKMQQKAKVEVGTDETVTEKLGRFAPAPAWETVLPDRAKGQETAVLGTVGLEIIQDIIYMQDTTEIG